MNRIGAETGFLARQSTIYGVGNILQRATSLVLLPVYTHYLTTTDYGVKELLTITVDVVAILVATAIAQALHRIYFQYDDEGERRQVISSAYVAMGVVGGLVVGGLMLLSAPLAGLVLDDPGLHLYMQLALGAIWFQILNKITLDYLRARQRAVRVVVWSLVRLLLSLGLNIWFIVGMRTGVVGVLWSTLITSAVMFILMTVPEMFRVGLRFSRPIMREMLTFGLPLVPAQMGGMIVHLSDRFFIKEMISIGDAGIYSLGYRLGTLSSMLVVEPFNQTWLPRRFEIQKQPDHERVFGRIFTYFTAGLVFFALATSALAGDLLRVISAPEYWSAAKVVPIIAVANAIFGLHYHLNFGLLLAKKTKIIAIINLTNGVLVLALNWLLIPRWGVYGAAVATLFAFIYKVGLTWIFSRRYYHPRFERRRLTLVVGFAVVFYAAARLVNPSDPWLSAAIHLVLVVCYPLALLAFGFLNTGEKQWIVQKIGRLRRR